MNTAMIDTATDSETRAQQKTANEQAKRDRDAAEKQKQRDAAEALYWDILCDPTRTTAADKSAFESARQTLGKTSDDVRDDVELVVKINTVDEANAEREAAHAKFLEAHEEYDQWTVGGERSGRNKAMAAVHAKTSLLEQAKEQAKQRHNDWHREHSERTNARRQNPAIVRRLNAGK